MDGEVPSEQESDHDSLRNPHCVNPGEDEARRMDLLVRGAIVGLGSVILVVALLFLSKTLEEDAELDEWASFRKSETFDTELAKALDLLDMYTDPSRSHEDKRKEIVRRRNVGLLPNLPEPNPRSAKASAEKAQAALRVGKCGADVNLATLKLAAAVISLNGAVVSCGNVGKTSAITPSPIVVDADPPLVVNGPYVKGNAPPIVKGRRLDLTAGGPSSGVHQDEMAAQMGCSVGVNGLVSSFTGVSQYLSGAIVDCPKSIDASVKDRAACANANSIMASGLTRIAAALSDIAIQCAPFVPIKEKKPSQKGWVMASCVVGVDQAATYLAKFGLTINGTRNHCERMSKDYNPTMCEGDIASEFSNIGLLFTYLGGAISECGSSIIVPAACENRVASAFSGVAYVAEASGKIAGSCSPKQLESASKGGTSETQRAVAVQLYDQEEGVAQSVNPVIAARTVAAAMLLGLVALWRHSMRGRVSASARSPEYSLISASARYR